MSAVVPDARRAPPRIDLVTAATHPLPVIELAHSIRHALVAGGVDVELIEETLPTATPDRVAVVIAPHEVPSAFEMEPRELQRRLARTILVSTARPSSAGWRRSLPLAHLAGAVLDISDAGVTAYASVGIQARRLRLGYDPTIDRSTGGIETRPLDVVFLGTSTPRRQRVIAAAARHLSRRDIDLRFTLGPARGSTPISNYVAGVEKHELLASAKIVLNIHPDDDPLFEWMRAQVALSNGCLLVSELSSGATPLDPGRHFVSVDHGHLGGTIDRLLDEPERLEEVRALGARFFREQVRLVDEVQIVSDVAAILPDRPAGRRPATAPDADEVEGTGHEPDEAATTEDALQSTIQRQNAVLKRLFVEIRNLRREVAHVRHAVEDPGEPLVRSTSTPGWEKGGAREVSVIISLYNYGRFVREAVESALASQDVGIEVIVIDDRSTDDGPEVIHRLMRDRPDEAILFLEQRVNTGAQRARNLAFAHARGPYAFVLDADNNVFPRGIAKLRDALARDPEAAFAYGIIERFGEDGGIDLMGLEGWDERRLAESHYIDAMALIRVDAWREVGGYVTDPALELGWEDYDLWLSFASHGYRGLHVREIVGRYRVHGISSLAITSLDTSELKQRLQERHRRFFRSVTNGD